MTATGAGATPAGSAGMHGTTCPRCEEAADVSVFRENRRPVARGRGVVRFLAAVVLAAMGVELLLRGNPDAAAAALAASVLSAGWCAKALAVIRSRESVAVLQCHHCSLRAPLGSWPGPNRVARG
ncbi:hypothetical protein ACWC5I_13425 [Kitasatospora sp. NPDC001574]